MKNLLAILCFVIRRFFRPQDTTVPATLTTSRSRLFPSHASPVAPATNPVLPSQHSDGGVVIKIDKVEVERRRYERGKADAESLYPPKELSESYRDGYVAGRQPGKTTRWGSRDRDW